MKMNSIKKVAAVVLSGVMCVNSVIPAVASTTSYNITVNKTGISDDSLSLRTMKDSGSAYEAKYYVTPTYFSCEASKGKIRFRSALVSNTNNDISSKLILDKSYLNRTVSGTYTYMVPSNVYYCLVTNYSSGTVASINSTGRYTP